MAIWCMIVAAFLPSRNWVIACTMLAAGKPASRAPSPIALPLVPWQFAQVAARLRPNSAWAAWAGDTALSPSARPSTRPVIDPLLRYEREKLCKHQFAGLKRQPIGWSEMRVLGHPSFNST